MQDALNELGGLVLRQSADNFLESLSEPLADTKKKKQQHVVVVNFNVESKTITFDTEEISQSTAAKYLWVGNADGPASPQWLFTTTKLEYLLSQTIPSAMDKLSDESSLKCNLQDVLTGFFRDLGAQSGAGRYKYILDLELLGLANKEVMGNIVGQKEVKKACVEAAKIIVAYLKQSLGLATDQIGLWSLAVNGNLLVNSPEYRELVIGQKVGNVFEAKESYCSLCGSERQITDITTRFSFKYYITDKIGFASDVDRKNFYKNMVLCQSCYSNLLVAEPYIKNNLSTRLGELNLYIIPAFLFSSSLGIQNINDWSAFVKYSFNTAKSFVGMVEFEQGLEEYRTYSDEANNYVLNLLFYRQSNAEFRVLSLIKDVPMTLLQTMYRVSTFIGETGDSLLGAYNDNDWVIDLEHIYRLIPLHVSRNGNEHKKLLQLYSDIFAGRPVSYHFLIDNFVKLAKIHQFEQYEGTNVKPYGGLTRSMLQANLMLLYLRKLNLVKEGEGMDFDVLQISDDMKDFIREMKYDEPKAALFLMGYLVSVVGNAQYSSGNESKPILHKIGFQGMNTFKVIRLVNELVDKLKQYKKLTYNEGVLFAAKQLLDKELPGWQLTDQENVFYIISGYSYGTNRVILAAKNKREEGAVNE